MQVVWVNSSSARRKGERAARRPSVYAAPRNTRTRVTAYAQARRLKSAFTPIPVRQMRGAQRKNASERAAEGARK